MSCLIHRVGFASTGLLAIATLVVALAAAAQNSIDSVGSIDSVDSIDSVEARVRQIYFEGYPIATSGRLEADAVDRLGEMLRDPTEEPYWSNIVLALGASENPDAHRHLAEFAADRPNGEVSSAVYQARVSLPVALGQLANRHPPALVLVEEMARDVRSEPGWRFQSLEGASLAGALRRSAITGLAVSGRPEASVVLTELEALATESAANRTRIAGAAATGPDELVAQLEFARTLHERVVSQGQSRALGRQPLSR